MATQNINPGIRFVSMIIDILLILLVFSFPFIILALFKVNNFETIEGIAFTGVVIYLGLSAIAVYVCKDCFNGRSVAKRIFKFQIIDKSTGLPASPIKCLIRNIFTLLLPVEVIIALINPEQRLGDLVTNTMLVHFEVKPDQPKPDFGNIVLVFVLTCGLLVLMFRPFISIKPSLLGPLNLYSYEVISEKINFVKSSYNKLESISTERLFRNKFGDQLTCIVKVYDQIQNKNLRYIDIYIKLNEYCYNDEDDFEKIKLSTIQLLLTKFPKKTFIGQIDYKYKKYGIKHSAYVTLNWEKKGNEIEFEKETLLSDLIKF